MPAALVLAAGSTYLGRPVAGIAVVFLVLATALAVAVLLQAGRGWNRVPAQFERLMTMQITSSAFAHNGAIPKRYPCEGTDVSPPLAWSGATLVGAYQKGR